MKKILILFSFLLMAIVPMAQINQFYFTGLTALAPTTISGQTNVVINAMSLGNINQGVLSGKAIRILNCTNVTITNCYIGATWNRALEIEDCVNVTIEQNFFANNGAGVYVRASTNVKVRYNQFTNCHIWTEKGQYVQFNNVYGTGNEIVGNVGESWYGESTPEDLISLFETNGTSGSPVLVANNTFRGGGISGSSGGIMSGDQGGSYQLVQANKLVNCGQYGIAASGGDFITLNNNEVYGVQKPWSNVGWYVSNYTSEPVLTCGNITVTNNKVNWINSAGNPNHAYNSNQCLPITETGNTYGQTLASMNVPTYLFNITEDKLWQIRDEASVFSSIIAVTRPTANAGADQNIGISTATLTGSGATTTYQWVQVSGPNTATIAAPTSASTGLSNLVNGTYVFRLQAYGTDNGQEVVDADWVSINVTLATNYFQFTDNSLIRWVDMKNIFKPIRKPNTDSVFNAFVYKAGDTSWSFLYKISDVATSYGKISGTPTITDTKVYTYPVQALTSSPADAATAYFGNMPKAPTTTAATSKVYVRQACTITFAEIYCYSGTAGTNEAWSVYIRKNNTTDYLVQTLSVNTSERVFTNTALNISMAAGDYFEIKMINPTWATNPLTTIFGGNVVATNTAAL